MGGSQYEDANSVPTSSLADDIATVPPGSVDGIRSGRSVYRAHLSRAPAFAGSSVRDRKKRGVRGTSSPTGVGSSRRVV